MLTKMKDFTNQKRVISIPISIEKSSTKNHKSLLFPQV